MNYARAEGATPIPNRSAGPGGWNARPGVSHTDPV